jgi:hypothetical protein
MKKTIYYALVAAGALLIGFAARDALRFYNEYQTQDESPTPTPTSSVMRSAETPEPASSANITVSSPTANSTVSLPFSVTGSARVFENVVNIAIKDSAGGVIYHANAEAKSPDVGQFGPFTHSVAFLEKSPANGAATLEVYWSSPKDGSPLDTVSVPLTLDLTDTRAVKIFFNNSKLDPEVSCNKVFAVDRIIPKTTAPAGAAISLLLQGPTGDEIGEGYMSSMPTGVKMPSIVIAQGTATINFGKDLEEGVGGSCRVAAIRAQIEKTLYQFPTISGVVIAVEGRTEDALQP